MFKASYFLIQILSLIVDFCYLVEYLDNIFKTKKEREKQKNKKKQAIPFID